MFDSEPFGQRAVRLGLITSEQVREALETQKLLAEKAGLLGEILVEMNWLDAIKYIEIVEQLSQEDAVRERDKIQDRFIQIALQNGYVTMDNISEARKIQADRVRKNKLIGQIMVEMGILDPTERDKVLATYKNNGRSN